MTRPAETPDESSPPAVNSSAAPASAASAAPPSAAHEAGASAAPRPTPPAVNSSAALAHQRLRRAVVRLELPPGAAMSEQRLAARFGLSKAAVRAALARLRAERLVLAEPRRGHVVAPLTLRDVGDVYALRLLLEPPAAAAAAGRLEEAAIARLREAVANDVDIDDPASIDRFLDGNRAVHVAIAGASGNGRLAAIVERLLDDSERAIGVALRAGAAAGGLRVRGEHEAVLDALAAADGTAAERLMRSAIERFRDELLDTLRGSAAVQDLPIGADSSKTQAAPVA
jgi:DNA-binding GntR family transcriptional regulator